MCFSTHCVVEAGQVGWRQAEEEVEQGQAKGEGEQHGDLRPGHLRQAAHRGAQVQADHALRPLRATQGYVCDASWLLVKYFTMMLCFGVSLYNCKNTPMR
ncbi:unnamed protein product [Triticum turgidum subsp. durum]|uniref:Uncharacterized protein n=1 Tax=Triticum turgidum subsp. durum TaxID=4567 RepID=A0A9R0WK18_TRITD|nr:unnamed protein product [Triticum turgidum subsp. durum]